MPAAVLWDMDGTLIDSEPYWMEAERALAAEFGVSWTDADGLDLVGRPIPVSAGIIQGKGVALPVDTIVERLLTSVISQIRVRIPWQEDARSLLDAVGAAGIPCALVTMSYESFASAVVASLPGVFDAVVTGDEPIAGKPAPDPYLLACERLSVPPEQCIVIEDSLSGVASGLASGARTIAVRRFVDVAPASGLVRVGSLDDVSVEMLPALVAGEPLDTWDGAAR